MADADTAGVMEGAGTKSICSSVYADVTLTSGAPATECLAAFLMQDNLLWVSRTMRKLSEAHTAAIRVAPRMERAHIQTAKVAKSELQMYPTSNPQRWQEVKHQMANTLPPQAGLFRKKLRASTWEDTKPLVAGTGHYLPNQGHDSGRTDDHDHGSHLPGNSWPPRQGPGVPRGANDRVEQREPRRRSGGAGLKNPWTQVQHGGFFPRPKPPRQGESQPGRPTAADSPGQPC